MEILIWCARKYFLSQDKISDVLISDILIRCARNQLSPSQRDECHTKEDTKNLEQATQNRRLRMDSSCSQGTRLGAYPRSDLLAIFSF